LLAVCFECMCLQTHEFRHACVHAQTHTHTESHGINRRKSSVMRKSSGTNTRKHIWTMESVLKSIQC